MQTRETQDWDGYGEHVGGFPGRGHRPTDQRWFWTPEWQAGEREADEQIVRGETNYYDNVENLLAAWERDR